MKFGAWKNDTHLGAYTKCRQFSQWICLFVLMRLACSICIIGNRRNWIITFILISTNHDEDNWKIFEPVVYILGCPFNGPQKEKNRVCKCIPPTFFRTTLAYSHPKCQPCKMTITRADLTTKFLIIDFFLLLPNISVDHHTIIFLLIQWNKNKN